MLTPLFALGFATGVAVGLTFGLLFAGFLGVKSYERGVNDTRTRRSFWKRELKARRDQQRDVQYDWEQPLVAVPVSAAPPPAPVATEIKVSETVLAVPEVASAQVQEPQGWGQERTPRSRPEHVTAQSAQPTWPAPESVYQADTALEPEQVPQDAVPVQAEAVALPVEDAAISTTEVTIPATEVTSPATKKPRAPRPKLLSPRAKKSTTTRKRPKKSVVEVSAEATTDAAAAPVEAEVEEQAALER